MCYNIKALSVFSSPKYTYYTPTTNLIFISPNFPFILVLIILCVCISLCVYKHECEYPGRPEESIGSLGSGAKGGYGPPSIGAGN